VTPIRVLGLVLLLGLTSPALADNPPSTAVADTLHITATTVTIGEDIKPITPGDDLERTVRQSPFALIRRGASSSSDLYADGFKKGDITVTIDGERFTTACPNRMDTRAGQVNLLDIELVELNRSGGYLQSGLGGQVAFRRRLPGEETRFQGSLMGSFDHAEEQDFSFSAEARRWRASLRYRRQDAWTDADGQTFTDLYGFAETPTASIFEAQAVKAWQHGDAVATYESSRDVLFPYLLMDERENDHYQASASHRGHRLYFNHNDHFMDNMLRTSAAMTDMRTDAKNTMFGAVGSFYDVYARNWDADNEIIPVANPAMATTNRMLPDVWRIYASLHHVIGDSSQVNLALRLGLSHTGVGDKSQADRYNLLDADAETDRWSVPFGATVSHHHALHHRWSLGWAAEVSSDDPGIEALYISVDKPGMKPTWLGNPGLDNPLRASLRAALQHRGFNLEVFGTKAWSYTYLTSSMVDAQMYQTYEGIDALLAGANLTWHGQYVDAGAHWNWGEKIEDNSPLAEIQPLTLSVAGRSPEYGPVYLHALYLHAAGQDRVDESLNEMSTGTWDRFDIGIGMNAGAWHVTVDLENAFNEQYAQHLSYLRNPFSSGLQVNEPGRTWRVRAMFLY